MPRKEKKLIFSTLVSFLIRYIKTLIFTLTKQNKRERREYLKDRFGKAGSFLAKHLESKEKRDAVIEGGRYVGDLLGYRNQQEPVPMMIDTNKPKAAGLLLPSGKKLAIEEID